jgi:predicted transcriptional regulator
MAKVVVEIDLSDEAAGRLDELIWSRCLDREKFLKKTLLEAIQEMLEKRKRALTAKKCGQAPLRTNLRGKRF